MKNENQAKGHKKKKKGHFNDDDDEDDMKECKDRLIISQGSNWKKVFDIWISILIGYSCFSSVF